MFASSDPTMPISPLNDTEKLSVLHGYIRVVLNVQETSIKRQEAIMNLKTFIVLPENQMIVRQSFDRLLPTLEQLLVDRSPNVRSGVASLLGTLGIVMVRSQDVNAHGFVLWIIQNLQPNARPDIKAQFLSILKQLLDGEKVAIQPFVATILAKIQYFLEEMQEYELLAPTLEIVDSLATNFPQLFGQHFQDMIDVLVGWRLDPHLPELAAQSITDTFVLLHPMWVQNMEFSLELLEKFITDMKAIASESIAVHANNVPRLSCFVNCFVSIVKSIGSDFNRQCNTVMSHLFDCISLVNEKCRDPNWIAVADQCMVYLAQLLGQDFPQFYTSFLQTIFIQLTPLPGALVTKTILESNLRIMESLGTNLPLNSLDNLINSLLSFELRLHTSTAVFNLVINSFKYLLNWKRVGRNIVEETVKYIVKELDMIFASLCPSLDASNQLPSENRLTCFVEHDMMNLFAFNVLVLEFLYVQDLTLSPRDDIVEIIVNTLSNKYHPFKIPALGMYPRIQLACLRTLKTLALSVSYGNRMAYELILSALQCDSLRSPGVLLFALDWLATMKDNIKDMVDICNVDYLLQLLFENANHRDDKVRYRVPAVLQLLLQSNLFGQYQLIAVVRFAIFRLGDSVPAVRSQYSLLLATIGCIVVMLDTDPVRSVLQCQQYSQYKIPDFARLCTLGLFKPHHFQRITHFIGQRHSENSSDWLAHIFYACQTPASLQHHSTDQKSKLWLDFATTSSTISANWACWECARFCVLTRLRTPFGNPVQTFEAIERMIQHTVAKEEINSGSTGSMELAPARLLLQFVDHLEKQIYDAYEGNLVHMAQTHKSVALFFRTNRKVCEDWFARIRQALMLTSVMCNAAPDTVWHAMQRALDLRLVAKHGAKDPRRFIVELEMAFLHFATALCELHDPDAIRGLVVWTKHKLLDNAKQSPFANCFKWMPGLALQSKGKYEYAAAEYRRVLQSEDLELCEPFVIEFMVNQITECYLKLAHWDLMKEWLAELQEYRADYAATALKNAFVLKRDVSYLNAFASFDAVCQQLKKLPKDVRFEEPWNHFNLIMPMIHANNSPAARLQESERLLLNAMLLQADPSQPKEKVNEILKEAKTIVEEPLAVLGEESIYQAFPYIVHLQCLQQLEGADNGSLSTFFQQYLHEGDLNQHKDIGLWNSLWRVRKFKEALIKSPEIATANQKLCHRMIKLARKEHNFDLAERLIGSTDSSFDISFEQAKLLYDKGQKQEAITQLMQLAQFLCINPTLSSSPTVTAKILLKFAKWIHEHRRSLSVHEIVKQMEKVRFFAYSKEMQQQAVSAAMLEEVAGKILAQASLIDPSYAKGNKIVDISSKLQDPKESNRHFYENQLKFNNLEYEKIRSIMFKYAHVHTLTDGMVQEIIKRAEAKLFENIGGLTQEWMYDTSENQSPSRQATNIIISLCPWTTREKAAIDELMTFWFAVRRRVLHHYEIAISCYFRFLQLRVATGNTENHQGQSDARVVATLKILQLLLKYGTEFEVVFKEGFASTPCVVFQDIVPQLFARLGHPEPSIRAQLVELICNVGKRSPRLIVYPAVVSHTIERDKDSQSSIQQIMASLLTHSPTLVSEVQLLISELTRITALWEEQWTIALQQAQNEISSRMRTFKNEIQRAQGTPEMESIVLLERKYLSIMAPTIAMLEELVHNTCMKPPETPHERWFQATYAEGLKRALHALKTPTKVVTHPELAWSPFKDMLKEFSRYLRPTSLRLQDISPQLAKSSFLAVPMPGVSNEEDGKIVTIHSFESNVVILPTKTRPKKITLIGSNGKKYAYLLKGSEDLHLDERVMQLLSVINQMLANDKETYTRGLRARTYAVIPLGSRSGLIQWVDGAIPLYGIYKQWQKREVVAQQLLKETPQGQAQNIAQSAAFKRPSDMFNAKIIPALKEHGITNVVSRKDWPFDVLKQVFKDLMAETPRNLISKELWSSSASPLEWWNKTQVFSRSVAVMSIIGYIIGLGDRHLDNILLDTQSGEVVHIDYNVCFEKGLKLKVPEKVPFRMTQNMQTAMGLTGIEGCFRIACEEVLRVLRKNKEVLLTLLEAFVYDPLVDWTADKAEDETHKNLELNVSLTLFASRITEMKTSLKENKNNFLAAFKLISEISQELRMQKHQLNSLEYQYNTLLDGFEINVITLDPSSTTEFSQTERELHQRLEYLRAKYNEYKKKYAVAKQELAQVLATDIGSMSEILSLVTTIIKITQQLEGAFHLHTMAKSLQGIQYNFVSELQAFVDNESDTFLENEQWMNFAQIVGKRYHQLFALAQSSTEYASHLQQYGGHKEEAENEEQEARNNQRRNSKKSSGGDNEENTSTQGSADEDDLNASVDVDASGEIDSPKREQNARSINALSTSPGSGGNSFNQLNERDAKSKEEKKETISISSITSDSFVSGSEDDEIEPLMIPDIIRSEEDGKVKGMKTKLKTPARNMYAVNVLNRVKSKLEGKDGTDQKMTIEEQVNWVIEEAIKIDNLCCLYEGWTPWI